MSQIVEVRTTRWVPRPAGPSVGVMLEYADPARLDDHDLVAAIAAAEAQAARMYSIQAELIAELAGRDAYTECGHDGEAVAPAHVHRPVVAAGQEISLALSMSPNQGIARTALAIELGGRRARTLAALRAGSVTLRQADAIVSGLATVDPGLRDQIEADLLSEAASLTDAQLRRKLNRAVMTADPAAAHRRHRDGHRDRRVEPPRDLDSADGIAELTLTGPAHDLTALYTAVDAAARAARAAGETRTLDQLRFDTLTGLGWTALSIGHLGCCAESAHPSARLSRRHGRPATVNVTVAFTTLVGLDDRPAELHGYGPVPAPVARRIAADATLRRLLTDPATGALLEYGRTTYQPPQTLAHLVVTRDRTCRFPTCDTPATTCDLDHTRPWEHGGTTGATNLHALSRRCHTHKTIHGWIVTRDDNGDTTWTSPAGHTRRVPPEAIGFPDPEPRPGSPPPPF